MQNPTITTTVHRSEVEADVATDWADEALALARRVNHKLSQPTATAVPSTVQEEDEYEPQALDAAKPAKRPGQR